jgi:hypothetical protein
MYFYLGNGEQSFFYHSLSVFVLLTKYFEIQEKSKGSFDDFRSKQKWNPKADNFLSWPIINEYS